MRDPVHKVVEATARKLAGKAHTKEELHAALFQLAIDIMTPARSGDDPPPFRRMPGANEVLPRHQRASWARGKTVYDQE
jgi:hypothetical protein